MKKISDNMMIAITCAIIFLMLLLSVPTTHAQQVIRKGNQFELVSSKGTKQADIKTQYTVKIADKVYPVYKSARGKYYILRVSKNGNTYKQYVTKIIEGESK